MSVEALLTIRVSVLSETLLNVPSMVLPFLSFTDSLLPFATEVSRDQSFIAACAATVMGESRIEVSRMTTVASCVVLVRIVFPCRSECLSDCGVDLHKLTDGPTFWRIDPH